MDIILIMDIIILICANISHNNSFFGLMLNNSSKQQLENLQKRKMSLNSFPIQYILLFTMDITNFIL